MSNFNFDTAGAEGYKSNSQRIRVMSEAWVASNVFCPICGNSHLAHLQNNAAVADFQCERCGEIYELKSKNGDFGNKILGGAYSVMVERITSSTNPNLLLMQYSKDLQVINLVLVPKFFLTPSLIEKRKPLPAGARRAGWTGCNILYSSIPEQGKIVIVKNQKFLNAGDVVAQYVQIKALQTPNLDTRGWLLDVLMCVNSLPGPGFSLRDMYEFVDILQARHPTNQNIEAKIRQQLQLLRDKRLIDFMRRGEYRKKGYN